MAVSEPLRAISRRHDRVGVSQSGGRLANLTLCRQPAETGRQTADDGRRDRPGGTNNWHRALASRVSHSPLHLTQAALQSTARRTASRRLPPPVTACHRLSRPVTTHYVPSRPVTASPDPPRAVQPSSDDSSRSSHRWIRPPPPPVPGRPSSVPHPARHDINTP